jgi:ribosomal protein L7Ae-like RNA K-turn-binding protein
MTTEKWKSLLGLAYRARKCISGEELVVKEIRNGKAKLVIISNDASANTRKKITDKCNTYSVPLAFVNSREALGQAIGKNERVVVAVLDEGFSTKLKDLLGEFNRG